MAITNKELEELTRTIECELNDLYRYAFYRLGDKQDAEDIIQDLYVALQTRTGETCSIGNLRSYIYRALSNNCTLLLRRRTQNKAVSIDEIGDISDAEPDNLEEEFTLINSLLESIPEEQSEVIRLHIHGNRTFAEIADILEIPPSTAKSRFKYGIGKLKSRLENSDK